MNQLMRGVPMTIFGDGTQTRAFSYTDDVAPYIARSAHVPRALNETINIGADRERTLSRLAELVACAFGRAPEIRHLEPRVEATHAVASHAKAQHILGAAETAPLEEGLERMARWAREVCPRASQAPPLEVTRGLPPFWASLTPDSNGQ